MSLNHIDLMGRLSKDVELRYTQSQKPVASFSIAVDRPGRDKGVDFFDIVAWNKTAEFVQSYFHKGDPIVISGRLQTRSWEDRDGKKRISHEIVASQVFFVPRVKGDKQEEYTEPQYSEMEDVDGELPF